MKRKLLLAVLLVGVIFFGGCGKIIDYAFAPKYDEKEEMIVAYGIDGEVRQYSGKVKVHLSDRIYYSDNVELNTTTTANPKEFYDYGEGVLSGYFSKVAYVDGKLFVLMYGTYYEFDINSYELPEVNYAELDYEPIKYTESEFEEKYSDCEEFNWTIQSWESEADGVRVAQAESLSQKILGVELPENTEVLRCEDSTDEFRVLLWIRDTADFDRIRNEANNSNGRYKIYFDDEGLIKINREIAVY